MTREMPFPWTAASRTPTALGVGLLLSFVVSPALPSQDFLAEELHAPVPLYSGGKVIESPTGYTSPLLVDVDGDGRLDLLVGDFGWGHEGIEDAEFPWKKFGIQEKLGFPAIGRNGYVSVYFNRGRAEEGSAEERIVDLVSGGFMKTRQGVAKAPTW